MKRTSTKLKTSNIEELLFRKPEIFQKTGMSAPCNFRALGGKNFQQLPGLAIRPLVLFWPRRDKTVYQKNFPGDSALKIILMAVTFAD